MSYILFDVGANNGSDSIEKTRNNLDIITFAFEPTPRLYEIIKNNTEDIKNRYFIYNYAVSDFIGNSKFNIAGHADWGCSSLNTFSDDLNQTWPGRFDFNVTEIINVEVITLKHFIDNICPITIKKIDYMHCDTQGSDLKVLKGLEEYITMIENGNIEVPDSESVKLYKENHSYDDAVLFLESNNFEIYNIAQQQNEKNLYFRKII
jgi:FkbM family methyltransferase